MSHALDALSQLQRFQSDVRKLSLARISDEFKSLLSQLLSVKLSESFVLPITSSESPFVLVLSQLIRMPAQQKFIPVMIDALSVHCFHGDPLRVLFEGLIPIAPHLPTDLAIRLLQTNANLLLENCTLCEVVCGIFSISLSLIDHQVSLVSTTAFATTQQMISILFESEASGEIYVVEGREFRGGLGSAWIVLRDLFLMAGKAPAKSLRCPERGWVSEILELMLTAHRGSICREGSLLELTESVFASALTNDNVDLMCTVLREFGSALPDQLRDFFSLLLEGELSTVTLALIRSCFIQAPALISDIGSENLVNLLRRLDAMCDSGKPLIDMTLPVEKPSTYASFQDRALFARTTAVEFTILFISHFVAIAKSDSEGLDALRPTLAIAWPSVVNLLVKGIRLCHTRFTDHIFRAYHHFLSLMSQYGLTDGTAVMLRILCSIVAKQPLVRSYPHPTELLANTFLHTAPEGFGFKSKRAVAAHMLVALLYGNPSFFSKFYSRVFVSLGLYGQAQVDPAFTQKLEDTELVTLCGVLVHGGQFSIRLLGAVLQANSERIGSAWPPIEAALPKVIADPDLRRDGIEMLLAVSSVWFRESQLAIMADAMAPPGSGEKTQILLHVRGILLHHSSEVTANWGDILRILSPRNCEGNGDLLSLSFASLSLVCSHFQRLGSEMETCLAVIFEFALNAVDINMSLSALGLLWEITPFVGDLSHFWKRILSGLFVFFNDPRSDLATGALKTFFSLLSSNVMGIHSEIYDHLLTECFVPFLQSLTSYDAPSWALQQMALLEICHCACSLWDRFADNAQFLSPFWDVLTEKQERLMLSCRNQDICVACLQFYEEALKCRDLGSLRGRLVLSFTRIVKEFFAMEQSMALVLSTIGRFLSSLVPTQKPFLDVRQITLWLSAVDDIAQRVAPTTKITLTAQKAIESVLLLFPIDRDIGLRILHTVVPILSQTKNAVLRASGIKLLGSALLPCDHLEYMLECRPLFSLPEAEELVKLIREQQVVVGRADGNEVFAILEAMGPPGLEKLAENLLCFGSKEQQRFLADIANDGSTLLKIWNRYCDPTSELFDRDFLDRNGEIFLRYIFARLHDGLEPEIMLVLQFLQMSMTYPRTIGALQDSTRWHLFGVIPFLFPLLGDGNENVSRTAHTILGVLDAELEQIIVD
jgi:hypothetical protein